MRKQLVALSLLTSLAYGDSLDIGFGALKFDYNEYSQNGTWLDSETNRGYDIDGFYLKYKKELGLVDEYFHNISIRHSYHEGNTNYDGYLQNTTTGTLTPFKNTTKNYLLQTHIRYEVENRLSDKSISIFGGLGYRMWDRDLLGPFGYLEEYEWPYWELGLSGIWYDRNYYTGFEISYQKAYKPKMKAYLAGGLDFDLGTTDGYKLEIPFGYVISDKINIKASYIYDVWDISRSNVIRGYVEPRSETRNQYIYFGIEYKF